MDQREEGNGMSAGTRYWKKVSTQKALMLMSFPFVIYVIVFAYVPIWGWLMAFQNYKLGIGMFSQQWVGLEHFKSLFVDDAFIRVMRNTLAMSIINLVLGFTTAIGLAILLNEFRSLLFKRAVQTISYLPHFISWTVGASLVLTMLSLDGPVNTLLVSLHIIDQPVMWMGIPHFFWGIIGLSNVWKEVGWNAIIYLAAMATINPSLYEAASIDGASRIRRIVHITLPGIRPIIVILMIMSIGHILDAGFEQQYLLQNGLVTDYSETIDIFVLKYGFSLGQFSFATAAGIFKTVVSIILLFGANSAAKRLGQERLI
jgi:putative aldouronate transport system permease protein